MPMSSSSHTTPFETLIQSRNQQHNFNLVLGLNPHCKCFQGLFPRLGKGQLPRLCWSFMAFLCSVTVSTSDTRKCLLLGKRQKWQHKFGFMRLATSAGICPMSTSKWDIFRIYTQLLVSACRMPAARVCEGFAFRHGPVQISRQETS